MCAPRVQMLLRVSLDEGAVTALGSASDQQARLLAPAPRVVTTAAANAALSCFSAQLIGPEGLVYTPRGRVYVVAAAHGSVCLLRRGVGFGDAHHFMHITHDAHSDWRIPTPGLAVVDIAQVPGAAAARCTLQRRVAVSVTTVHPARDPGPRSHRWRRPWCVGLGLRAAERPSRAVRACGSRRGAPMRSVRRVTRRTRPAQIRARSP